MKLSQMFAVFLAVAVLATAARAEDEKVPPPPIEPTKMEEMAKANPYYPKMDKKEREIGTKLDEKALTHLYHVREGFGAVQAVSIVRRDVATAVKACARDNPDMKDDIEERFAEWTGTVDPVIATKKEEIDKAVSGQTYIKAKEIREYLKLFEQTAEYSNKALDKGSINTEPEACKNLMKSMDHTQDVVAKLLGEIELLPWPPVEEKSNWAAPKVAN